MLVQRLTRRFDLRPGVLLQAQEQTPGSNTSKTVRYRITSPASYTGSHSHDGVETEFYSVAAKRYVQPNKRDAWKGDWIRTKHQRVLNVPVKFEPSPTDSSLAQPEIDALLKSVDRLFQQRLREGRISKSEQKLYEGFIPRLKTAIHDAYHWVATPYTWGNDNKERISLATVMKAPKNSNPGNQPQNNADTRKQILMEIGSVFHLGKIYQLWDPPSAEFNISS